jgi:hypothetical protein
MELRTGTVGGRPPREKQSRVLIIPSQAGTVLKMYIYQTKIYPQTPKIIGQSCEIQIESPTRHHHGRFQKCTYCTVVTRGTFEKKLISSRGSSRRCMYNYSTLRLTFASSDLRPLNRGVACRPVCCLAFLLVLGYL